jgi:hypothetical protein
MLELIILALLPCIDFDTMEYHIHVHVDGIEIPGNIGIEPGCFREMHTHDDSGWLHLESSVIKQFTMRQFFEVWGRDAMDYTFMTINGEWANYDTPLRNGDQIVIRR